MRGLCECGCGLETSIAKRTTNSERVKKGQHRSFVRGHGYRKHQMSRGEYRSTYQSWTAMHARCRPGTKFSKYYSDRGIAVCDGFGAGKESALLPDSNYRRGN